jgi:hypothetical protein
MLFVMEHKGASFLVGKKDKFAKVKVRRHFYCKPEKENAKLKPRALIVC